MLKPGDKAPDFELLNQDDEVVRLLDFRGQKVVLFSFPRAGTPDCTRQACAYRDYYEQFTAANAVVFGITSNSTDALRLWREENDFPFDLLSDGSHAILQAFGIWGQAVIGVIEIPAVKRSYWLIDETGVIRERKIGIKPEEGLQEALLFIQSEAVIEE